MCLVATNPCSAFKRLSNIQGKVTSHQDIRMDIVNDKVTDIINSARPLELEGIY